MVCMIKNSSSAEFHGACSNIACCRSGSYAEEAHLPCPEYENEVAGEESFTAKVMFYSSIHVLKQTAVACDAYTENVTESNRRIKKIIFKSLATNYTTTRDQCRAALLEIQAIHVGLSQQTAKTLVMFKAEGPSPYGEETIDDA